VIRKYIEFMRESKGKSGSLYKHGCVMLELNIGNWDELTDSIDPKDVYLPDDPSHGVETNPHVTIMYPVDPDRTFTNVTDILDKIKVKKPKIEIDGIGIFENSEFDVLKFTIINNSILQNLHDRLSILGQDKFDKFKPHITIAYLKSGSGKKYINQNYHYTIDVDRIKYTTPSGEKFYYSI
jgi:2'-5' RNA ligase